MNSDGVAELDQISSVCPDILRKQVFGFLGGGTPSIRHGISGCGRPRSYEASGGIESRLIDFCANCP